MTHVAMHKPCTPLRPYVLLTHSLTVFCQPKFKHDVRLLVVLLTAVLVLCRQATCETTVLDARIMAGGVLELKLKRPRNSSLWRAPPFSYK